MKMLVISLIIFLIILTIWVMFHFPYIEDPISDYYERLVEASSLVYLGEWDTVSVSLNNFFDDWENTRKLWAYYLNQNDIDNIELSIRKLDVYVINKNKILTLAEIEQLKKLFKVIIETECLTLDNIF